MVYLADAVLLLHALFVVFVVFGVLAVVRWPRLAWLHIPCLFWGIWIELSGGICPLTPLENHLRAAAGEARYQGGFLAHYLMPLIYPAGLTRTMQIVFGVLALGLSVLGYGWILSRRGKKNP